MSKQYKRSLFIFRRDLRLEDNTGLIHALKNSDHVIPAFIFTPEQTGKSNKYRSNNCIQFMIESLQDLDKQLKKKGSKLFYFYGKQHLIVKSLIKDLDLDAVFVNRDYTPYAVKRDDNIKKICDSLDVDFLSFEDCLLNPVASVTTGSNQIYKKFTPYYDSAKKIKVDTPSKNRFNNYIKKDIKLKNQFKGSLNEFYTENENIADKGGRTEGLKRLKAAGTQQKQYNDKRNFLTYQTTHLSAYNKFGCVSIREVYHHLKTKLGVKNDLIKQLYWRDFFYNIAYAYPDLLRETNKVNRNFNKKYSKAPWIKWDTATTKQKSMFKAWCLGKTGYPIVDAAMREMNCTGFMGNRARLVSASFLTKLMMWHWQDGERYFAQKLIDYDPAQNNGNWQFTSGSGVDAQPYFRIFNPWEQAKKYDPDCVFIKKWIPELKDIPPKQIHSLYKIDTDIDYPKPVIDYETARDSTIKKLQKVTKV